MNKKEIEEILAMTSPLTQEELERIDWGVHMLWHEEKGVQGVLIPQSQFIRLIASHKLLAKQVAKQGMT